MASYRGASAARTQTARGDVTKTQLFRVLDEAHGYLRSPHTAYKSNWQAVYNRVYDWLQRYGESVVTLKQYSDLVSQVRKLRVMEGQALEFTCQGRTQSGAVCLLKEGHGGYHRSKI